MIKKETIKEFLKPSPKKIIFSILIFIVIEIVLWLMTEACAFSCPKPPTFCQSYCLLDKKNLLPASGISFIISYLISCVVRPKKRSISRLFLIFVLIAILAFFTGFFIYPYVGSILAFIFTF